MTELCKRLAPGDRIASFGYPDIIGKPKEIEAILGSKIYRLEYRKDSEAIQEWHNVDHKIPDAHSFFELQGVSLDVFDVAKHRGCEEIIDLNEPIDHLDYGYDFVLDPGTIEHCFNIGQAAYNMVQMLKRGGIIMHENPFNWANHGFYNMNPTWYADFYGQDGFELLGLQMVTRDQKHIGNVPKMKRFGFFQEEANIIAVAKRVELLPIQFPVQGKYKRMIPDAGARASEPPSKRAIGE